MSHFYGTLHGSRGDASRCGSKESGMRTNCASWEGNVNCRAWHDNASGCDMVTVSLTRWEGSGIDHVLYTGPLNPGSIVATERDGVGLFPGRCTMPTLVGKVSVEP